jgi:hypothetical protein
MDYKKQEQKFSIAAYGLLLGSLAMSDYNFE